MRVASLLLCSLAGSAAAEPATWHDTVALDTLDGELAAIASGLGASGPIDCAIYHRVSPYIQALPARIAEVTAARGRLVETVQKDWRAQHVGELEHRIADVVMRLRRDKQCAAIVGGDAAHLAARAIVVLAAHPGMQRPAAVETTSTCASELREMFALSAVLPSPWQPTPLEELAMAVEATDEMRLIDAAPLACRGPFGGEPRVGGAGLGDL
ncbi:MAG: hypothetical protein ABI867_37095 [Kofleriaceae bacterium]